MRHYIGSSLLLVSLILGHSVAFTPTYKAPSLTINHNNVNTLSRFQRNPFLVGHVPITSYRHQPRKNSSLTRVMGLFGLGGGEIAVILVAVFFLVGPQKLAELGRSAGKLTGELKEIPKEFQKGLEEGEIDVRAKSAKPMDATDT
jgi:sec-independent protein translocase protein TatA